MADIIEIMKQKIEILNKASKAYYQEDTEIMSNMEFDRLYDELAELERETGIVLSNSPTVRVGYELLSELPKERHEKPMLSLDKTKDIKSLAEWLGNRVGVLSWKLDGITIVLTYSDGNLVKAVTRGNGEIGEVVTNNVKVFRNIPLSITCKKNLVIRGEAVIGYSDFERINNSIENVGARFKNPRNLCSGSVRHLNNKITAERSVYFFAFSIVKSEDLDFDNSRANQLEWLKKQGFDIVQYKVVNSANLKEAVQWFSDRIAKYDYPADGLVLSYDDLSYSESLGSTAKFPRDSIAFKWQDEIKKTKLLKIEWSTSRTGLINPIAVFEPVELEGTTVKRASVHNISVMESLKLGIGDTILVYKANMIIPQISQNLTMSGPVKTPENCPVCSGKTLIREENDVKFLYCTNDECIAKKIKSFTHFVSRDAMGIEGLSEATMEKFISMGFIKKYADIFMLDEHKTAIMEMEGFGEKSFNRLWNAVNKAKKTNTVRLLYSLGIPNIGLSNAKLICRNFSYEWERIENATFEQLTNIPGIGDVIANEFIKFFRDERNKSTVSELISVLEIEKPDELDNKQIFSNLQFVVTGSLQHFSNRSELKNLIESYGGKVTNSVTSKTNYLINNDSMSGSSKNKKARELGISIISENTLLDWIDRGLPPGSEPV
jgi:DNA ligase (NAD+)